MQKNVLVIRLFVCFVVGVVEKIIIFIWVYSSALPSSGVARLGMLPFCRGSRYYNFSGPPVW